MSEIVRKHIKGKKLKADPAFKSFTVPKGFGAGVESPIVLAGESFKRGPDESVVAQSAGRLSVRLDSALRDYRKAKADAISNGASKEAAEFRAQRQLDDVAEMVKRAAIEAKDGAVIADMASALTALGKSDPASLSMVMRRAGNPEIFQPLLNSELPDVPDSPAARRDAENQVAMDAVAAQSEASATSRDKLPLIYRPSSSFRVPDYVSESGKAQKGGDVFKNRWKPKNHSLDDVPTQRIIKDKETGEWREFDDRLDAGREKEAQYVDGAASTRKELLGRLAGDQIAQMKAIEGTAKKPTGRKATLPKKVAGKGEARIGEDTLTVGTGESGSQNWSGKKKRPIDNEVDTLNRGDSQRVFDTLEHAVRTNGKVNIDFVAPYARARIPEIGPDGKLTYPDALPTPEYITGLVIGWHGFPYGKYDQWVDVIRRSYDDWPDYAPNATAAKWEGRVLADPSKSFMKAMQRGVGSEHYPHKIYGPRQLPRPKVERPDNTPIQAAPQSPDVDAALRSIEEYRKKYSKKPGNNETSSIYTMPSQSPLGGLLA